MTLHQCHPCSILSVTVPNSTNAVFYNSTNLRAGARDRDLQIDLETQTWPNYSEDMPPHRK